MDFDEAGPTPRSGRKKKSSALSRFAAQRGKTPQSSINSDDSVKRTESEQLPPKYPIDANVEIHNQKQIILAEDSDEGIEIGGHDRKRQEMGRIADPNALDSSSGSTIRKLKHLNMDSGLTDEDNADVGDGQGNNKYLDSMLQKGEKRTRDTNSSGEELAVDSGRRNNKKHVHTRAEVIRNEHNPSEAESRTERNKFQLGESAGSTNSVLRKSVLREDSHESFIRSKTFVKEDRASTSNERFRETKDQSLTDQYREALELEEKGSYNHQEKSEMYDNLGDLRPGPSQSPPPPFRRNYSGSSLQASALNSWDTKPWSSLQRTDSVSERSYQSSSVMPQISTKDVKERLVCLWFH